MAWKVLSFLVTILCVTAFRCNCLEDEGQQPRGLINDIINNTMEKLRPELADLYIDHEVFETGPQEFGDLEGHFDNITVRGLDQFKIVILDTSLVNLNNLTIVVEKITLDGLYYMNGTMAFPLGKNDIHFFGNGKMSANFSNFSISMRLKIHYLDGKKVVKELEILVNLGKMRVQLKNLMGGGELETVFNQLINDVGLTVFNYYKKPILDEIKPKIVKILNEILNQESDEESAKDEL